MSNLQQTLKPLLIRADASVAVGTGHVMRCLALAQAWQDRGGMVAWIATELPSALEERLNVENIAVRHITVAIGGAEDAAQTAQAARDLNAAWIVADGYRFDTAYQSAIRSAGVPMMLLDDYGHATHYEADLVLNQNLGASEDLYASRSPNTQLLLGPRFALLRREFLAWRDWRREIPSVARKLLVTLGGSDPQNLTGRVLAAIEQIDLEKLEVAVVVGGSNPHQAELAAQVASSRHNVQLHENVADMAQLMAWADAAVAAAGSTSWERALLGLPSLALVLADNQIGVAAGLNTAGCAWIIENPEQLLPETLAASLCDLLVSQSSRSELAINSASLVDGRGAERVVGMILKDKHFLRPATHRDVKTVWNWSNEAEVRQYAFNPSPIPWDTHTSWFNHKLASAECLFLILESPPGSPIGQIRFDQVHDQEVIVSLSLSAKNQGQGYGRVLLEKGCAFAFAHFNADRIVALVLPENSKSIKMFERSRFAYSGHRLVANTKASCYILTRREHGAPAVNWLHGISTSKAN